MWAKSIKTFMNFGISSILCGIAVKQEELSQGVCDTSLIKPTPSPSGYMMMSCPGNGANITYVTLILFGIIIFGVIWEISHRKEG